MSGSRRFRCERGAGARRASEQLQRDALEAIAAAPNKAQITASTQNQLEKSFSSATAVARQYPQYANAITAGAKTSFLHGADRAYAAGVITTVVGIALVFFLFPRKDSEQQLLGEYHQADSTQVKASPAAAAPAE